MKRLTAIVTGAGRGIGRALAVRLAAGSYNVVCAARTASELEETAQHVQAAGGRCVILPEDLADPGSSERIVARACEEFGGVDLLINNAAAGQVASIETLTDQSLDRCLAVNIRAVVTLCRAVWPVMRGAGGGVIVNVSSYAAVDPFPGLGLYGATKAFLHVWTRALADEGRPHNIRVYTVALGAVETRMLRSAFPDFPPERCLSPEEVAAQIELLLDERNRFATGDTIFVRR